MRLRHGIGLGVFCLLASSRWLVDAQWPGTLPPLLTQSLHYTVAGVVTYPLLSICKIKVKGSVLRLFHVALAGLLLLGAPALLQQLASAISPETSVSLYAAVPLCVILSMAMMNNEGSRALMMPALVGLLAVLLLLPWRLPSTPGAGIADGFVAVGVVLTAIGSVWLQTLTRGTYWLYAVAAIAWSNAVVLGCIGLVRGERASSMASGDFIAMLVDVPQFFLLVWLIRELTPEQVAARFLVVPLITVLEGVVVLRASLDARMVVGILLLLSGAGPLLFGKRESIVSLGLR